MTGVKTRDREIEITSEEYDDSIVDVEFDYMNNDVLIQRAVEKLGLCTQMEVMKETGLGPTCVNRLLHRLGNNGRIVQKKAKVRRKTDYCHRFTWVYLSIAEAKKRHITQTKTK